jgi:hypothetical protein
MNVGYVDEQRSKQSTYYSDAGSSLPETKVEEKRADLLSSRSPLVFPSDLTDQFYIEFNAFKFNQERPEEAKRTFNFHKSVYLPFPSTVTDQYGASYSQDNLFFGGEFLKKSLNTLMTSEGTKKVENLLPGGGAADRAGNILADLVEKTTDSPMQAAAAVATYGLTGVGGPIGAAAKASLNVTTNPYPVMIYQGTNFKSFGFSWTFFPESSKETDIINKIIGYFRREMLPERVTGIESILKYPAVFEIKIEPELKLFKRCVITGLDVNYTPAGPAFVKELPVASSNFIEAAAVSVTIQFQEIEMWLANDFYSQESKNFGHKNANRQRL